MKRIPGYLGLFLLINRQSCNNVHTTNFSIENTLSATFHDTCMVHVALVRKRNTSHVFQYIEKMPTLSFQ